MQAKTRPRHDSHDIPRTYTTNRLRMKTVVKGFNTAKNFNFEPVTATRISRPRHRGTETNLSPGPIGNVNAVISRAADDRLKASGKT